MLTLTIHESLSTDIPVLMMDSQEVHQCLTNDGFFPGGRHEGLATLENQAVPCTISLSEQQQKHMVPPLPAQAMCCCRWTRRAARWSCCCC